MYKLFTIIAFVFCLFVSTGCVHHDIELYKQKMSTYDARESMALEIFKMPDTTSTANLMAEIQDRGLYYWQQNIDLVREMDELSLPDSLHLQDKKLIAYCNLRIKSYNLMYKAISESTPKYKDSIAACNKEIDRAIHGLSTN